MLEAKCVPENGQNAAALIASAEYEIIFPTPIENLKNILQTLMEQTSLMVTKRTKKGMVEADIREDIHSLLQAEDKNNLVVNAVLAAGSLRNVKPELVAKLICEASGQTFNPYCMVYKRKKLMFGKESEPSHEENLC